MGRYGKHVRRDVLIDPFTTTTTDVYCDYWGTKTVIQQHADVFGNRTEEVHRYERGPAIHVDVDPVTPMAIFTLGAMVGGGEKFSKGVQQMKVARNRTQYWDGARAAVGGAAMVLAVVTAAVTLAAVARPRRFRSW